MRKRFVIEVDEEALRSELEELKIERTSAQRFVKGIEDSIKDKVSVLEEGKKDFEKKWSQLWEDIGKIEMRARKYICTFPLEVNPYYGVSDYRIGIDTNIRKDVIEAIKKVVGISKLKHSEVEEIAKVLVLIRLGKSKKYKQLIQKRSEMRKQNSDAMKAIQQIKLDAKLFDAQSVLCTINRRIAQIEPILTNPKKWKKEQEKIRLRIWATSDEGVATINKKLLEIRKRNRKLFGK